MNVSHLTEILIEEFPGLSLPLVNHRSEVTSLTTSLDSVSTGSVYVAVSGANGDGHSHLAAAKKSGAVLLVGEKDLKGELQNEIQVSDSRLALGLLASQIEGNPSREMTVIGVTGTSGKTTTTYLIESILKTAGMTVGLLGTISYRIHGREIPSTHTTPGPIELQQLLRRMRTAGCNAVVMEVSSHALKQHRAAGVAFDGVVFTNLSPEHLDYHPDMEDYYASKRILFLEQAARSRRWGKTPRLSIHSANPAGNRLLQETQIPVGFSVPTDLDLHADGIRGTFSGIQLISPLIGRFNAENIAAAVSITQAIGISAEAIQDGIQGLIHVPGRLERIEDSRGKRIILVDYAHKPAALESVLSTLRPLRGQGSRLLTVVGCGGDRDRVKRPAMGEIACRLSDWVIFTSDNPRTENPAEILREIEAGCSAYSNFEMELDRFKAIHSAVRLAKGGDIVLIAGKGHEDYQIIGTEKIQFDDREVAKSAINATF